LIHPIEGTDAMNPRQITTSRRAKTIATTVPEIALLGTVEMTPISNPAASARPRGSAPAIENGTVVKFPSPATRHQASESRREWLTEAEVDRLCDAARKRGRYGHRDATMILMAYRHGLRVSELVALRWDQIRLDDGRLHVIRRKNGDDSVQPLSGGEIRALRRIRREQPAGTRFVFVSERGAPFSTKGVFQMMRRAGIACGLPDMHPHLLRHGCGYKLVNDGVDTRTIAAYLGHRNMANTARYTKMDARRFDGFWRD
jgi:type 1 fimbriae regulatory protein FimB/type 1 fimbriae regulatory protein FimE